jgi:hypothetical protein
MGDNAVFNFCREFSQIGEVGNRSVEPPCSHLFSGRKGDDNGSIEANRGTLDLPASFVTSQFSAILVSPFLAVVPILSTASAASSWQKLNTAPASDICTYSEAEPIFETSSGHIIYRPNCCGIPATRDLPCLYDRTLFDEDLRDFAYQAISRYGLVRQPHPSAGANLRRICDQI